MFRSALKMVGLVLAPAGPARPFFRSLVLEPCVQAYFLEICAPVKDGTQHKYSDQIIAKAIGKGKSAYRCRSHTGAETTPGRLA